MSIMVAKKQHVDYMDKKELKCGKEAATSSYVLNLSLGSQQISHSSALRAWKKKQNNLSLGRYGINTLGVLVGTWSCLEQDFKL